MADAISAPISAVSKLAAKAFKDTRTAAVTIGVGTVIVSHTLILVLPDDESSKTNHAYINLAAAAAIVYGSRILG
jgi:hypothetical protein